MYFKNYNVLVIYGSNALEDRIKTGISRNGFLGSYWFWWDPEHSGGHRQERNFRQSFPMWVSGQQPVRKVHSSCASIPGWAMAFREPRGEVAGLWNPAACAEASRPKLSSPSMAFRSLRQSFCRWESLGQTFKDSGKSPCDHDIQMSGDNRASVIVPRSVIWMPREIG